MRKEPAPAEKLLWDRLRDRQLSNLKFRRQFAVLGYIADFYCAECRLIIELDGDSHTEQEEYGASRSHELQRQGFTVIRFSNVDVFEHLDDVLEEILRVAESLVSRDRPSPQPSPPSTGERGPE